MKQIYRNIFNILFGVSAAMFLSCTAERDIDSSSADVSGEGGSVSISFDAGGVITRADVAGNGDLNENAVNRLDLYVTTKNGTFAHKYLTITTDATTKAITVGGNGTSLTTTDGIYTWREVSGLSKDDIDGQDVYLVANWDADKANGISSLSALQAALIAPTDFTPQEQTSFVMDGVITASLKNNLTNTTEKPNDWTLSTIDLKRALAKIRLTVIMEDKNDNSSSAARTIKDVTTDVAYCMSNYAPDGTVIATKSQDEAEAVTVKDYPTELTTEVTYLGTSDMLTGSKLLTETLTSDRYAYYNGNTINLKDSFPSGYKAVVFYSYPNDWLDKTKAYIGGDSMKISTNIYTEKPILTNRQTLFYVKTTYDGSNKYFYKVPVNYELPQISDVPVSTWTATQRGDFRNLYRLQRNHIYDIVAFIDRQGGQDGIFISYSANDWKDGGTYTISDVAAELTATNADATMKLVQLTDVEADQNAMAVAYSSTDQTSYSPQLTLDISKLDNDDSDNKRTWILHTDNPNFQFLEGSETTAKDQITGSGSSKVSFRLVPKAEIPTDVTNYNRTARVYLTVTAGGTVKVPLTTSLPYDIKTSEAVFYQVPASEYTTTE